MEHRLKGVDVKLETHETQMQTLADSLHVTKALVDDSQVTTITYYMSGGRILLII
jgi:hypothetical protein